MFQMFRFRVRFLLAMLSATCLVSCASLHNEIGPASHPATETRARNVLHEAATCTVSPSGGCCENADFTWSCSSGCTETPSTGPGHMVCTTFGGFIQVPPNFPPYSQVLNPTGPGGASGYKPPPGKSLPPLTNAQNRWSKAHLYKDTITKNAIGNHGVPAPDGGLNACVWVLQQIQFLAGLQPLAPTSDEPYGTTNVEVLRNWLASGNGTQIMDQSKTVAGDLVIQGDGNAANGEKHAGMCEDNGCTVMISNQSHGPFGTYQNPVPSFTWEVSPTTMANSYNPILANGFWHVTAPGH